MGSGGDGTNAESKEGLTGAAAPGAEQPVQQYALPTVTLVGLGVGVVSASACTALLIHLDPAVGALQLDGAVALCAGSLFYWLLSVLSSDVSIVDLWWPQSYVLQAWVFAFSVPDGFSSTRKLATLALVSVWGARLAIHLTLRKWREGWEEDRRYPERVLVLVRGQVPSIVFHLVSLLQVFVMQGSWMWLVGQSLLVVFVHGESPECDDEPLLSTCGLGVFDAVAAALWLIGFVFEAGSDLQLQLFKADPSKRGTVCDGGFFKYTRHPNYFGDFTVWLSFFCVAAPLNGGYGVMSIGSPLLMFILLRFVSGVTINDAVQAKKPKYKNYIATTPAFFPWCRKDLDAASAAALTGPE
jgi:steroid 5-alpha reductase family enzyme